MARAEKSPRLGPWRLVLWGGAALALLAPLVAMQFTDEVAWTGFDFAFAGALMLGVGVAYEAAVRVRRDIAYRAAVAVALAAALALVWVNGAVGIIGSEDNPANLMYGGVLAVGIVGAGVARFQPAGMARALIATALAQAVVSAIALAAGVATLALNAGFIGLWLGSAWLFRKAAERREEAKAAS
ncbi:MAG: hypothetical protein ACREE0_15040 [Phenylobacterium sp.]